MSENFIPCERWAAAYQATKHVQVLTGADLVAVVKGLTGISVQEAPRADITFPYGRSERHLQLIDARRGRLVGARIVAQSL